MAFSDEQIRAIQKKKSAATETPLGSQPETDGQAVELGEDYPDNQIPHEIGWKVLLGETEQTAPDIKTVRAWFEEKVVQANTHVFHPDKQKWMCLRDLEELAALVPANTTLIEQYREDYSRVLLALDHDVADLINHGKEWQAITVMEQNLSTINKIHQDLENIYGFVFTYLPILKHFGSERLKRRKPGYEPFATQGILKRANIDLAKERPITTSLSFAGYNRTHWFFGESVLLREIDYMLDVLESLLEPEFMPPVSSSSVGIALPDRYIPAVVKQAVWHRDGFRCVQCKSQEKLEFDHIIPIAKGGSNSEHNIQILCQTCNRQKGVNIQ